MLNYYLDPLGYKLTILGVKFLIYRSGEVAKMFHCCRCLITVERSPETVFYLSSLCIRARLAALPQGPKKLLQEFLLQIMSRVP